MVYYKKSCTFAPSKSNEADKTIDFGLWCNGNTTDSGPVFLGSSPSSPTSYKSGSLHGEDTVNISLGYGVMVTQQILVLFFLVRVRVAQQIKSILEKIQDAFFFYIFFRYVFGAQD